MIYLAEIKRYTRPKKAKWYEPKGWVSGYSKMILVNAKDSKEALSKATYYAKNNQSLSNYDNILIGITI